MILYLVKSAMPYFVAKQDEAKRDARQLKCNWEQVEVPTADGREALADFLNTLGGPASITIEPVAEEDETVGCVTGDPHSEDTPSYVDQSVAFEDQFEKMPLAQK